MHVLPQSTVWRIPKFNNLELLHVTHSFPPHTHERFAIGVIEQGALDFFYRGANMVAAPGQINLCIPGEMHTGQPATPDGWSYRMFYFDVTTLQQIAADVAETPRDVPFFQAGILNDVALAQQLRSLHRQLAQNASSTLAQETALLGIVTQLIQRHADAPLHSRPAKREQTAVSKIKSYLHQLYAEDVSLNDLARHVILSRYYLVRVFKTAVGGPPHAYLRQLRIRHAKTLLAAGLPIADVAHATGFRDQRHLTRWFKTLWGFTPGQYRNNVQDTTH
mgnify:CR=1 FL=1